MSTPPELPPETELQNAQSHLNALRAALNEVLFGQEALIEQVLVCLLAGGHLLLEGLPGLGKTELLRALSQAVGLEAGRIQFTPDLLPGDITGNPMLREVAGEAQFVFQPGPLFCNLVLADEINRAGPKTQSALLEAMQERRVTSMGKRHPLPEPFFVMATQNPIELEGTYPLPEAQLDRFLFKLEVTPGGVEVLERIVNHRRMGQSVEVRPVMTGEVFRGLIALAQCIYLPGVVSNYIARLVFATHHGNSDAAEAVKYGASPRAAIGLAAAGRARALLQGRENVDFRDIEAVAVPVLQHRLVLHYPAKLDGATGEGVVRKLLRELPHNPEPLPPTLAPC